MLSHHILIYNNIVLFIFRTKTAFISRVTISGSNSFNQSGSVTDNVYNKPTKQPDINRDSQSSKPLDTTSDWTYLIFPIAGILAVIIVLIACKYTKN
jgi:hypothetical protein